jgi:hypothetical protein
LTDFGIHGIKRTSFFFNSFPRGGLPRKAQLAYYNHQPTTLNNTQ